MSNKLGFRKAVLVGFIISNLVVTPAMAQIVPPAQVTVPVPPPAPVPVPVPPPVAPVVAPVVAPTDTTAPVISEVASLSLGLLDATIVWLTDELAVSTLEYGASLGYGSSATLGVSALLAHTAILTGLTANTTYYYCIHATDGLGNASSSCGHSFMTAAEQTIIDTTPPDVTEISVSSITSSSATLSWTTSEVANGEVEYGTTAGYGESTNLNTDLALNHSVNLNNLSANTEYHYRIRASDQLGNLVVTPDNIFTTATAAQGEVVVAPAPAPSPSPSLSPTPSPSPVPVPVPSPAPVVEPSTNVSAGSSVGGVSIIMSGVEVSDLSFNNATISWTTDFPSDSQVEYGDSENFGALSQINSSPVIHHSVVLHDLAADTNYIFRVRSQPSAGTAVLSGNHEFTTLSHSTPVVAAANVSSVASSNITETAATITWSTDKAATSQVQFGLSSGYGEWSAFSSSMATSHSVNLTGLTANTTYHFRVNSIDEVSNETFSEDYTFTTQPIQTGQPAQTAPATIITLAVGAYDPNSVELVWNVASTNTDISHEYDIRYSVSPINPANFQNAAEAQVTPVYHSDLSPTGTHRAYIVAGLNSDTLYYFAIKSKLENTGWSDLSNVVSVATTKHESINNETALVAHENSGVGHREAGGGVSEPGASYGGGAAGGSSASFEPTLLKAEPADREVILQWNNPGEENFVRTVIVRNESGYPTSPTDGQTLYEGRGNTFTDTSLQNGKTYYYAAYSYNHSKTYSSAVHVSLAPNAGNVEIKFNESGAIERSTPNFHFVRNFKRGDKDIEVEHLQEMLIADADSYPEKLVTGYFGALTEAALKRFQQKHGLAITGVVDPVTQQKLTQLSRSETRLEIPEDVVVFSTDLKLGDQGEAVKDLQQYLIYEGSYVGALVTGYFGNYTKAAVQKFQKKYGIVPVSGFVGYKTRHRMQQLAGL